MLGAVLALHRRPRHLPNSRDTPPIQSVSIYALYHTFEGGGKDKKKETKLGLANSKATNFGDWYGADPTAHLLIANCDTNIHLSLEQLAAGRISCS